MGECKANEEPRASAQGGSTCKRKKARHLGRCEADPGAGQTKQCLREMLLTSCTSQYRLNNLHRFWLSEPTLMLVPHLGRARESPSLFLLPNEGSGAPRRRMAWISPDRPDLTGGPGSPGPWRISGCARVLSTRHAAFRLYAFNGSVGPARSLSATGGLPAAARGRGSRSPRSRVPHPAPPLRRLATTPLSGRDVCNLR